MSLRRQAYLVVRPTEAGTTFPTVPATWTSHAVDAGWSEHRRLDGLVLHALRLNTNQIDPADGIWIVVQREPEGTAALEELAAAPNNTAAASLKDTWTAARAGNATARAVLRHIPDWKITGFGKDDAGDPVAITGEVHRIFPRNSGARIPADVLTGGAGPWHLDGNGTEVAHGDPAEVLHVTTWHRPGLLQEIAGYDDHTPEDGTPED